MEEISAQDYVPSENQTIVVKRNARLADRLSRSKVGMTRGWWSSTLLETSALLSIVGLNLGIVFQFLGTAAKGTAFSGPLVPVITKGLSLFGLEFQHALQVINGIFYLGFVVSLYFLVKMVSGRKMVAFLTVLITSMPIAAMAESRILMSFVGFDSPHIASLSILLAVILLVHGFVKNGGMLRLWLVVLGIVLVGLTSPTGFLSLVVFAGITVFSEMLLGDGRIKVIRAVMAFGSAMGVMCFWYSPGFLYWLVMGDVGLELRAVVARLVPVSMFLVPVVGIFGYLLFDRKPTWQPIFLALFYTGSFFAVNVASGWHKFLGEFGLSLAFLVAIVVVKAFEKFGKRGIGWVGIGVIMIASIVVTGSMMGREYDNDFRVLGMWTDVEKDRIWVKRDEFLRSPLAYLGTVISSFTLIGLFGLGLMANKQARA